MESEGVIADKVFSSLFSSVYFAVFHSVVLPGEVMIDWAVYLDMVCSQMYSAKIGSRKVQTIWCSISHGNEYSKWII